MQHAAWSEWRDAIRQNWNAADLRNHRCQQLPSLKFSESIPDSKDEHSKGQWFAYHLIHWYRASDNVHALQPFRSELALHNPARLNDRLERDKRLNPPRTIPQLIQTFGNLAAAYLREEDEIIDRVTEQLTEPLSDSSDYGSDESQDYAFLEKANGDDSRSQDYSALRRFAFDRLSSALLGQGHLLPTLQGSSTLALTGSPLSSPTRLSNPAFTFSTPSTFGL